MGAIDIYAEKDGEDRELSHVGSWRADEAVQEEVETLGCGLLG